MTDQDFLGLKVREAGEYLLRQSDDEQARLRWLWNRKHGFTFAGPEAPPQREERSLVALVARRFSRRAG